MNSCERVYQHFLPTEGPAVVGGGSGGGRGGFGGGGGHNDFSEGSRPTQEGCRSGPHNGSSHVLAVDSSASAVLAAEREEVHIVVGERFFFYLALMDRQWLRRGEGFGSVRAKMGNVCVFFFSLFLSTGIRKKTQLYLNVFFLLFSMICLCKNKASGDKNFLFKRFWMIVSLNAIIFVKST